MADSASEQAASLEETSTALEEITSMTKRNAKNRVNGTVLGRQARDAAEAGRERLQEMRRTLSGNQLAVGVISLTP